MRRLLLAALACWPALGGYGYSRAITIDHTKAGSSNSTNFTVLISGAYSYLATVANSGKVQNTVACGANSITCPADLIYASDSGCATPLSWEIESYTAATGLIVAWVKVPTLAFATDTVIYECYGNAAVSTFLGGSTGAAFDASTKSVYHLASTTIKDSGASALDMTSNGTPSTTTGQIGTGISYPTGSEYSPDVSFAAANTGAPGTASFTMSGWVKWNAFNGMDSYPVAFLGDGSNMFQIDASNQVSFMLFDVSSRGNTSGLSAPVSLSTWYHLAATWNGSHLILYVNGAVASDTVQVPFAALSDAPLHINNTSGAGGWFQGFRHHAISADEVSIANAVRSPDWITAAYNNQFNPSTFYTVSAELGSASAPRLTLMGVGP